MQTQANQCASLNTAINAYIGQTQSGQASFINQFDGGQQQTATMFTSGSANSTQDVLHALPSQATLFQANPTMAVMSTNGAQLILASPNSSNSALIQTQTGAQMIVPSSAISSSQLINATNPQVTMMNAINSQMNQVVQVLLGNGQVVTTTLANLPALGINAVQQQPQYTQYPSYQSLNSYQTQLQTQIVTNAAGQVFALTPQNTILQATPQAAMISPQSIMISSGTQQASTQFVQITQNPLQMVSTFNPTMQQLSQVQQQSHLNAINLSNASTSSLSPSQTESEIDATKLHVQQIIQQQQQILEQQGNKTSFLAFSQPSSDVKDAQQKQTNRTQTCVIVQKKSVDNFLEKSKENPQSSSAMNSNSSTTPQPTVSSTTNLSNVETNTNQTSLTQVNESNNTSQSTNFNPDRISVQSQTSSPASLTGSCAMEPESTTQNNQITISNTDASIVDGVNLEEIKEFARQFKLRRISLGLTQTQVGQALSATEGPSYSQSAICRFEKLDITPKSAQKIKPVLENWMEEAEERYKTGTNTLTDFIGNDNNKKRKRRTSFTPAALDILNHFFEKNTHPTGSEMTELAERLNYDREVVRVWFCNKRQALRNTIKRLEPTTAGAAATTTTVILA